MERRPHEGRPERSWPLVVALAAAATALIALLWWLLMGLTSMPGCGGG
ncbi:MAG TPA: hypothetical protein VE777_05525 [Gaiellales bacterium]|nr:hypothetical protein [Gaiellales bacterium]